ncbi:MAG: ferredoxin-type protein NapF [Magnetovibrio sp.]|nr:ferredoxin-type protein NapF [Magnetovibrio sp.]
MGNPSQPVSLSRRSFFKGRVHASANPAMRPPWALSETQFVDTCTTCDKCLSACNEGILVPGDAGFPTVDFQNGECTFCGDCIKVCTPGALSINDNETPTPWQHYAEIGSGCLSANGITCRVCGDRCDTRAIRFQLAVGGVAHPILDTSTCTGCGACIAPCPVGAVKIQHVQSEEHQMEERS